MRAVFPWLLWLGLCFAATPLEARPALDVLAGGQQPAESFMTWCATPLDATVESVSAGACRLQALLRPQVTPGFDRRAFWLHLELSNPGSMAVERWITVGHPRLANVSLFVPEERGWARFDVGNFSPMVDRGRVERDFGALPVTIPPSSQQSVWLRVQSDTALDLATTVWSPLDLVAARQANQFWVSLGLGGLLITVLFSLLMLMLTRQVAYGYFALGLSGSLFTVCLSSGLLQRFLWPQDYPLPSVFIALGNLLAVLGYFGFIRAFLPQRKRYRWTYGFLKLAVVTTVGVLLVAILIDYLSVRAISGGFILAMVLGVVLLAWQAWRDGDQSAGILLLAFSIHGGLVVYRLSFAVGILTWQPEASVIGVWGMILSAPVVLLGLVSRTRQLQTELVLAQSENNAQLAFFARLSHELRSPLDTILGNAQLLARMGQGSAFRSGLTAIFESGRHLLGMIDHLLDYARGLSGAIRINPAPVDMDAFLRGMERSGRLFAAKRHNEFVMSRGTGSREGGYRFLELDSGLLREVLDNLLSNAGRYTQAGRMGLDYRATLLSPGKMQLEFTVWDTGEGIAEADLQRIFTPFERVGQPGYQHTKGVGLGLAIARHLTELMGGHLKVESTLGQGSRFSFWIVAQALPDVAPTQDDGLAGMEAVGYDGERRTILLVDDDDGNRTILTGLLSGLGFTIVQAHSGDEAAVLLKGLEQLDLVITDQFMPHGDGWQVLEAVGDLHPDVPVFLVSAAPPTPGARPTNGRFDRHFLRPLDHSRLLESISDRLGLTWSGVETAFASEPVNEDGPGAPDVLPSFSELRVLEGLVETGQVTAIEAWARQIQLLNPACEAYVQRVLLALQALDFQALRELAKPTGLTVRDGVASNRLSGS